MAKKSKQLYYLPNEIIHHILLNLPVKSLVRLGCVCKSWLNLITSNKDFVRSHLKRAVADNDNHVQLVTLSHITDWVQDEDCDELPDYDLSAGDQAVKLRDLSIQSTNNNRNNSTLILDIGEKFFVAGCCDGIICLYKVCTDLLYIEEAKTRTIYLWNPALHQCRTIETEEDSEISYYDFVGFCRNPKNQDHEVVKISWLGIISSIGLYSLEKDEWRSTIWSDSLLDKIIRKDVYSPLDFNGCLHWIAEVKEDKWGDRTENSVLTFDIADEELEIFLIPSPLGLMTEIMCLGVVNACLSFVTDICLGEGCWEVWSMKTYGVPESWTKVIVIPYAAPELHDSCYFFGINSNGKFLFKNGNSVFTFDHVAEKRLAAADFAYSEEYVHFTVIDYVESLVSVMPLSLPES